MVVKTYASDAVKVRREMIVPGGLTSGTMLLVVVAMSVEEKGPCQRLLMLCGA